MDPADLVTVPISGNHTVFLSGLPGSGKTTLAVRRLLALLEQGVSPAEILVLLPQRTLGWPYYDALRPTGARVRVATISGLARQFVQRFWPEVAGAAGFRPEVPPRFLSFETVQYVLNRIAQPYISGGAFDGVAVARPRLLAQIVDNLDHAAAAGFPADQIAARLKAAWAGDTARERVYDQVQAVALAFRRVCLESSLLDWSLQVDTFLRHVLALPDARRALFGGYRHLIVDNSDENPPVVHDLLRQWLPYCESAVVVHDVGGGYRTLLGADPDGSLELASICREHVSLPGSHVPTPEVAALGAGLSAALGHPLEGGRTWNDLGDGVPLVERRLYPEMLDWAAEQVSRLVMEEGVLPHDIALLLPRVSDSAQFALAERLAPFGIPLQAHRPARALSGDPVVDALLTWARLAHPAWRWPPSPDEVAHAFLLSIDDLDPVRARLLVDIVYRVREGQPRLTSFQQIVPAMQDRIGLLLGGRYDQVWQWLQAYLATARRGGALPLAQFFRRLVDEALGQPGLSFGAGSADAASAEIVIESAGRFEAAVAPLGASTPESLGLEYATMVDRGIVAGQYLASWEPGAQPGVLLASPLTFLLMNRPVRVQIWLDVGSRAWFERVVQPLSQPYVLRRAWPAGRVWTDQDEVGERLRWLAQLVTGLATHCRERIYLAYSELNERGYEQRGPLLQAISTLTRQASRAGAKVSHE